MIRTVRNKRITTGLNTTTDQNLKKEQTTKITVSDKRQIKTNLNIVSSIKAGKPCITNTLPKNVESSGGIGSQW